MKKWIIALAAVLLAGGAAAGVLYWRNARIAAAEAAAEQSRLVLEQRAEQSQQQAHETYEQYLTQAEQLRLTVTERGEPVGSFPLTELGLDPAADVARCFGAAEQLPPEDFAALPQEDKLDWARTRGNLLDSVSPDCAALNPEPVLAALRALPRQAAQDCSCRCDAGRYIVDPEQPGTELQETAVVELLRATLTGSSFTAEPSELRCELTDCDCYLPPERCAADTDFDWAAELKQDTAGLQIPVQFHEQTELLDAAPLLSVDDSGAVSVDSAALTEIVNQWTEAHRESWAPFRFNSLLEGEIQLDFLYCNYEPDAAALQSLLEYQLLRLDDTAVDAPMLCTDLYGRPLELGDSYVEVDIANQRMSFFWEGELLTTTDVVSGRVWGHATPTGLYHVQSIAPDCWLTGPDYCVFVKYWVGFYDAYGIHDASWRSVFGGEEYLTNGSHGCVNTPDDPMDIIYHTIQLGTPVLVH